MSEEEGDATFVASPAAFIALAEKVAEVLDEHEIEALVIGGFALAAHNYMRTTEDLDLGINASRPLLEAVRNSLIDRGFSVVLRLPDGQDPLGGVIDVEDGTGALVQIVNFDNYPSGGFPRAIKDALAVAVPLMQSTRLRVIPLPHLVALKIYAGGRDSQADVRELLRANPDVDLDALRALCKQYRLKVGDLF